MSPYPLQWDALRSSQYCYLSYVQYIYCTTGMLSTNDKVIFNNSHYGDVIMGAIASQIISLTIVCSTVYSDADERRHQSSASLAFVWGIRRGPVNSPHKWPVTRKMFPFDDVIMCAAKCGSGLDCMDTGKRLSSTLFTTKLVTGLLHPLVVTGLTMGNTFSCHDIIMSYSFDRSN